MAGKSGHRRFGHLRRLPSKRWQASYVAPNGVRYTAPTTFAAKVDAEGFLANTARAIELGTWTAPTARTTLPTAATFGAFAQAWLADRELKPTTRDHYKDLLDRFILPTLGEIRLEAFDGTLIRDWYRTLDKSKPTQRAHVYSLARTILNGAVSEERISVNPCTIRGAGATKRVKRIRPATLSELETIAAHLPPKYAVLMLLTAWTAIRFGEATELRRGDLDLKNGVLRVRRGVVRTKQGRQVGTPKSSAGVRDIAVPPHLLPTLRAYVETLPLRGRDGLLFPAADGQSHIAPSTLYRVWYPARQAAGRPDLRWHDLRHSGAVLAAQSGATIAELQARLGHSTPAMAMAYQHVARGRDAEIAAAMSRMVDGAAR